MAKPHVIRLFSENNNPPPHYDHTDMSTTLTLMFDGSVVHYPFFNFVGGEARMIDYFNFGVTSIEGLKKICDEIGVKGVKDFYIQSEAGRFKKILNDNEIQFYFVKTVNSSNTRRIMTIYVDNEPPILDGDEGEASDADLEHFSESDYDVDSDTDGAIDVNFEEVPGLQLANVPINVEGINTQEHGGDEHIEGDRVGNAEKEKTVHVGPYGCNVQDTEEDDIVRVDDILLSDRESDDETARGPWTTFNAKDVFNPQFKVGLRFYDRNMFRFAVHSHAIMKQRRLKIKKNDLKRLYVKCEGIVGCPFKIHAKRYEGQGETYVIRAYNPEHLCSETMDIRNLTSKWLAEKYIDLFRTDPNRSIEGFRLDSVAALSCNVSSHQAYRARREAKLLIQGTATEQYALLWDYIEEVRRTNPGSTLVMSTDNSSGGNYFVKLYVCLAAMKEGMLAGNRPVIGLDGCHLKGPHKGILLTAVGVDPNNNIFPIAWAVVRSETTETWEWFMSNLKTDLSIVDDSYWTIMSDKQKGLIRAVGMVFPMAEHRFCVRHLHGNFKKAGYQGDYYKMKLWVAARATTEEEFKIRFGELVGLNEALRTWFADKPPTQWSKAYFSTRPKCDILLNNGCESFNAVILKAREMPILSMLEWLMDYVMKRQQKNRDRAKDSWKSKVCPKIVSIMDKTAEDARQYQPLKSDDTRFMVSRMGSSRVTVDIGAKTCGCRAWDLSGIPCVHAIRAIGSQRSLDRLDFVHDYYSVQTYKNVYAPIVIPTNGKELWRKTTMVPVKPPPTDTPTVGRPSNDARRPEEDEPVHKGKKKGRGKPPGMSTLNPGTLKREQETQTCSYCTVRGHNKRTCSKKKEDLNANPTDATTEADTQANAEATTQPTVVDDGGSSSQFSSQLSNNPPLSAPVQSSATTELPPRRKQPVSPTRASKRTKGNATASAPFKPPESTTKKGATSSAKAPTTSKPVPKRKRATK